MVRSVAFALALTAAAPVTAGAADKDKAAAPSGTWVRESNGLELQFAFSKDTCVITVTHDTNGAVVTCKCKSEKDGKVTLTVTDAKEKGNFPATPKDGTEFGFKFTVTGDKATISDFTGPGADEAKNAVEGEYEKKK